MNNVNVTKDVFTTFDVAKICNANITSIKNWIERGKLKAFRTPGGHYRIRKQVLIEFLDLYEMPNPFEMGEDKSVLVLGNDPGVVELIRRSLGGDAEVTGTDSPLEAAIMLGDIKPTCLIIDLAMDASSGIELVSKVRGHKSLRRTSIISYTATDESDFVTKAKAIGVDDFASPSQGIEHLHAKLKSALH